MNIWNNTNYLNNFSHGINLTIVQLLLLVFMFVSLAAVIYGCDSDSQTSGPVAILTATESKFVPGRIELDGSRSKVIGGSRVLISQTYTVEDLETGEIVFGPEILTELLDQALIKIYLPAGNYVVTLTVVADSSITETNDLSVDVKQDEISTDTSEVEFSLDAVIASGTSDCDATCSSSSGSDQVACTLSTSCSSVDLVSDVMDVATALNSEIDEDTTMWIQSWGGSGGHGRKCNVRGGQRGGGGFAQMITTLADFSDSYSTTTIYYYLGNGGRHQSKCPGSTSGSGGTSSIVATIEPSIDNYFELDDIVVLAGGGGGVSERDGGGGGHGGSAISTTASADSAAGENAAHGNHEGKGGNSDGDGNGGGGGKDEGGPGSSGIGGDGGSLGAGQNECMSGPGWENDTPTLDDDAGEGGHGGGDSDGCFSGAGGGGYGGGGGGSTSEDGRYLGGGGGGSYAAISTTSDSDAPDDYQFHKGKGEVVITFNTSPN